MILTLLIYIFAAKGFVEYVNYLVERWLSKW